MSFKEKVCGRTHTRTTEDGQRPITMPYLEPLGQVSKKKIKLCICTI